MFAITQIMDPDAAVREGRRALDLAYTSMFVSRDDARCEAGYDKDPEEFDSAISSLGEKSKFKILERKFIDRWWPDVSAQYELVRATVDSLYERSVICSPFYRSSINLNVYSSPGDSHAAHIDSNPIANLLCLIEGRPVQIFDPELGQFFDVPLLPGELLTFEGRDLLHRVPPCGNEVRVVASMNLYFIDDCYRPSGLDEVAYGES